MEMTARQFWMLVHLGLGAVLLHGLMKGALWLYRGEHVRRLAQATAAMALVAWLTAITGTWIVYPWYRAKPPHGVNVLNYPKSYLVATPSLTGWHEFGMEWKEHVGWLSPMLATAVCWIVFRYGPQLAEEPKIRRVLLVMFVLAFGTALVSGVLGTFINKIAPNTFLNEG
jgi:hypothetical protein